MNKVIEHGRACGKSAVTDTVDNKKSGTSKVAEVGAARVCPEKRMEGVA